MHAIRVDSNDATWTGGEGGYFQPLVIRSADTGLNWQSIAIGHPGYHGGDNAVYAIAVDPGDPRIVLLAMEGQILRTSDGGTTWATVRGPQEQRYFYGVEFSRTRTNRVYATGSVPHTSEEQDLLVLVSADDGNSWTDIKGPSGLKDGGRSMVAAQLNGREVVYIGSGNGVYRYIDD